jgi:hypothetical protein
MSNDDKAIHLAELEVKRNRTLADLDTLADAVRSAKRSMEAYHKKPVDIIQQYAAALERDDLPEQRQRELYQEWSRFLSSTDAEFQEMVEEWERLHLQQKILSKMIREINRQIEDLKREFAE